jgi:DNA-binding NarL/FixJ family response regulator
LSITLVSPDGITTPSLSPFRPRMARELTAVRDTDDVVVLYDRRPAQQVGRLRRLLGRSMPAVLVTASTYDEQDVVAAFEHGATSYLLVSEFPEYCMVEATQRTARGESCLSPRCATLLLRHLHQPTPVDIDESAETGILTPRERQVMELLVVGHTIGEIAAYFDLTAKTVRNNLSRIYAKLQVRRQSEAILLWLGHQPKVTHLEARH